MPLDESTLWDPEDHAGLRKRIEAGTIEEMSRIFPAEYGTVRVKADNWRYGGKEHYGLKDQRKALMENSFLARPLKADITLEDTATGEVLDRKEDFTLMRVPYYTDRGTFIHNGNDYTGVIQRRLIPGAYTRRQAGGALQTQFNVRGGTGKVFRVSLDQETGQFRLNTAGSDLHLYSVLKDAGVPDEDLVDAWGEDVFNLNKAKYDVRAARKAYEKLVPAYVRQEAGDAVDFRASILDAFNRAQVADSAINKTLGGYWKELSPRLKEAGAFYDLLVAPLLAAPKDKKAAYDVREQGDADDEGDTYRPVGAAGILASTRKLLAVNRGMDTVDDRNIPAFSKLYPMDKLLRERLRLDEGKIRRNMMRMISMRRSLSPLVPRVFDPYYSEFITKSPMTSPLEETNPLQLTGQHRRVTQMGPGGIGSDDVITSDMQMVQPDEWGFYSPLEGPESVRSGIDVRLAVGTKIGQDGRVRRQVLNRRTGTRDWVSPEDLYGKLLKLPD